MNIKQAKDQLKYAITAYLSRDEYGEYRIPSHQQRPLFLLGAPGVGKTAIVEQVAGEMGIGLVNYSMTHHTRQSALGLPFIEHKRFAGKEFDVSSYTMSEIIASVYEVMEQTGVREGILFLDEINCVSETLSPIMLQFLQYKMFGSHRVPEGWVVVTAGNPPEFNNSVHEFDVVTMDRLKRIDVAPDLAAWKDYALQTGVHPAILTYLNIQPEHFYRVETTVDGKTFVTARGWVDLSRMLRVCETEKLPVNVDLVGEYLQNPRVAREFAQYYDLFCKYSGDYQVDSILEGKASQAIKARAAAARFDERLALVGLLLDTVSDQVMRVMDQYTMLTQLTSVLREYRADLVRVRSGAAPSSLYQDLLDKKQRELEAGRQAGSMSQRDQRVMRRLIGCMTAQSALLSGVSDPKAAFSALQKDHDAQVSAVRKQSDRVKQQMDHLFDFAELVWKDGNELLIITTELTARRDCAQFIAKFGCQAYFRHNKDLLLHQREGELQHLLDGLKLN